MKKTMIGSKCECNINYYDNMIDEECLCKLLIKNKSKWLKNFY
jgi:hypothetical protein